MQRFASFEDLDAQNVTIEEREEYEQHIAAGTVVYAGVDYKAILRQAWAPGAPPCVILKGVYSCAGGMQDCKVQHCVQMGSSAHIFLRVVFLHAICAHLRMHGTRQLTL